MGSAVFLRRTRHLVGNWLYAGSGRIAPWLGRDDLYVVPLLPAIVRAGAMCRGESDGEVGMQSAEMQNNDRGRSYLLSAF